MRRWFVYERGDVFYQHRARTVHEIITTPIQRRTGSTYTGVHLGVRCHKHAPVHQVKMALSSRTCDAQVVALVIPCILHSYLHIIRFLLDTCPCREPNLTTFARTCGQTPNFTCWQTYSPHGTPLDQMITQYRRPQHPGRRKRPMFWCSLSHPYRRQR